MKRAAGTMVLLTALGGCVTTGGGGPSSDAAPWSRAVSNAGSVGGCGTGSPMCVAGMQGPWGQPVPMAAPYAYSPNAPSGAEAARAMMATNMPLDLVQQAKFTPNPAVGGGIVPVSGNMITPPGVPCAPGMPAGAVAAVGALTGPGASPAAAGRTEVRFAGPAGMKISWYTPGAPAGAAVLQAPARYNFLQAAIYRLKLSDIPNRPGLELYPTLEVVPANRKTEAFLAHSAVPVVFTEEDLDQVASGNYVVKVIYLPDPQFQDLATTGPDEVVSSRLEPGVDPIAEACRRGSILLVVRVGNIDLEAPNTPAMNAPSPYQQMRPGMPGGHAQNLPPYPQQMPAMGMGMPGMGPGSMMLPPGVVPPPAATGTGAAPTPVSKVTHDSAVKPAGFNTKAAADAAAKTETKPAPEKKSKTWHWFSDSDDKNNATKSDSDTPRSRSWMFGG